MEINHEVSPLSGVVDGSQVNLIYEGLLLQRQDAETDGDFEKYVRIEEKLQQLEEFEAQRLERQARILETQIRIRTAQQQLEAPSGLPPGLENL